MAAAHSDPLIEIRQKAMTPGAVGRPHALVTSTHIGVQVCLATSSVLFCSYRNLQSFLDAVLCILLVQWSSMKTMVEAKID